MTFKEKCETLCWVDLNDYDRLHRSFREGIYKIRVSYPALASNGDTCVEHRLLYSGESESKAKEAWDKAYATRS